MLLNKISNKSRKNKLHKTRIKHTRDITKRYNIKKRIKVSNKFKHLKRVIFIINLIFLSLNILFLFNNSIKFKTTDIFCMNLIKQNYRTISTYLNNKYNINNKPSSKEISPNKKPIKVQFTGQVIDMISWLNQRMEGMNDKFNIIYHVPNPDYLIYNVYNSDDLNEKYKDNIIRIAFYTENQIPTMNNADYIFSHSHITYLDRYFKNSIFLWEKFSEIKKIREDVIKNPIRKKFCAGAITNCGATFRLDFIHKLNNYKIVDLGGSCENNLGGKVKDKIKFLSDYKFSIAMENSEGDGYISEKIVDSFRAGTIPIYYGDYFIEEFFNPKTYILIKGEKDFNEKIEYIKKIDNDDKLYLDIMKENPFIDEKFLDKIDKKEIGEFLSNIFEQDKNKAFRRDDYFSDYDCHNNCR